MHAFIAADELHFCPCTFKLGSCTCVCHSSADHIHAPAPHQLPEETQALGAGDQGPAGLRSLFLLTLSPACNFVHVAQEWDTGVYLLLFLFPVLFSPLLG